MRDRPYLAGQSPNGNSASFIGDTVRTGPELTQTNKQPSRQSDALPCVNVGYHRGPPSLSPRRTSAGPDKLALAAPRALLGAAVLMLATGDLIGRRNTSHIQIKVTQPGLCETPASMGARGRQKPSRSVPKSIYALLFGAQSVQTRAALRR